MTITGTDNSIEDWRVENAQFSSKTIIISKESGILKGWSYYWKQLGTIAKLTW